MIKHYSLKALEKAINKALNLDSQSKKRLKALEGKRIEIIITPLSSHFFIHFHDEKLHLLEAMQEPPNTIIHTSPLGLIRLSLLPASKVRSLFNDSIKISGDLNLGQKVKALFDEIDIDWEGHLAQFTGDIVAHQIGRFVKKTIHLGQGAKKSFEENMREYLHEETRLLPSQEELNDFFKEIDDLVLKTERLEAHLNTYKKKYETD